MKYARTSSERTIQMLDHQENTVTVLIPETVIEVLTLNEGQNISDMFHADVVSEFIQVADGVQVGWIKDDSGSFVEPPAETEPPSLIPSTNTGL